MLKSLRIHLKSFLALLAILVGIIFISQKITVFPLHDFLEYWSAGRINLTGGNPYSPEEMIALQHQIGRVQPDALMMWNPPWLLALTMPFSIITYSTSRMIWFLLELLVLFVSADMLWTLYGGDSRKRWIAWIAVLFFGPTLHTLKLGQITPVILLGSVGFLYFQQKGKPFWAGVLVSLILIKPHLLYLFMVAVLLWSLKSKNWKVIAGMAVGILLPFILASLPNVHLISQYIYAIRNYPPEDWQTATLGTPLRYLFGQDLFFLQFVPSIIGLIWLGIYWLIYNKKWNWLTVLPVIIVVSTTTAAYGWAHDVSILAFTIVQVATYYSFKKWTIKSMIVFTTFWLVSLLNAFLNTSQHWFWWLSSFYLVWYILANHWLIKQSPERGLVNDHPLETDFQ